MVKWWLTLTFIRFTTLVVHSIYFLYFKTVIPSWFWLRPPGQVPHVSHYLFFGRNNAIGFFSIPTWIIKEVKIATVTDSGSNVIFWQTSPAIPNAPSEKPTLKHCRSKIVYWSLISLKLSLCTTDYRYLKHILNWKNPFEIGIGKIHFSIFFDGFKAAGNDHDRYR